MAFSHHFAVIFPAILPYYAANPVTADLNLYYATKIILFSIKKIRFLLRFHNYITLSLQRKKNTQLNRKSYHQNICCSDIQSDLICKYLYLSECGYVCIYTYIYIASVRIYIYICAYIQYICIHIHTFTHIDMNILDLPIYLYYIECINR